MLRTENLAGTFLTREFAGCPLRVLPVFGLAGLACLGHPSGLRDRAAASPRRPAGRAWLMPSDERSLPGGDHEESLLPDGRENALPMHAEDTLLVVATMDGVVHTVEGASGALLWSFDSGGKLLSSSSLDRLQQQAVAMVEPEP